MRVSAWDAEVAGQIPEELCGWPEGRCRGVGTERACRVREERPVGGPGPLAVIDGRCEHAAGPP